MYGDALAQTILSVPGGPFVACLPLLIFCGLLRPVQRGVRLVEEGRLAGRGSHGPPSRSDATGRRVGSAISLNSIELALIAELNREQARDHDAVANDPRTRPEKRLAAARAASQWRARASVFQVQAQRQSAQPIVPDYQTMDDGLGVVYAGPERRQRTRRTRKRRATAAPRGLERHNRQAIGNRRRGDRRRSELASLVRIGR